MIDRSYEITLRRRIPFVSNVLYIAFIISFISLVIFFFLPDILEIVNEFYPHFSGTYKVSVFILVCSLLGTVIFGTLYFNFKRRIKAVLTFQQDGISIVSEKENMYIKHTSIIKILCSDLKNWRRQPKQQLQIVIKQKRKRVTSFRLAEYSLVEEFIDDISAIRDIPFFFYDNAFIEDDENENLRNRLPEG